MSQPYPNKVLMVTPDFFDVTYAINPYMTDSHGNLNHVDTILAKKQWQDLKATYQKLGFEVSTLTGQPNLPDMVFAANQSFPFIDPSTKKRSVLLSEMRSQFRKPEVVFFENLYKELNYVVYRLESQNLCFEGNGDALIQPGTDTVWGGFGPRTDEKVYQEMSQRFNLNVVPLELVSKDFYHLDTCFSILNETTVAIQPDAFTKEALKKIEQGFPKIIRVDYQENLNFFACNCHSPDGKNVLIQKGSQDFKSKLFQAGFNIHELETSEFIKAGGSVFCLKMMLF